MKKEMLKLAKEINDEHNGGKGYNKIEMKYLESVTLLKLYGMDEDEAKETVKRLMFKAADQVCS